MSESEKLSEQERDLLKSLADGSKEFDVGRCPVAAIALGWELSGKELVHISRDRICITPAGRRALGRTET